MNVNVEKNVKDHAARGKKENAAKDHARNAVEENVAVKMNTAARDMAAYTVY